MLLFHLQVRGFDSGFLGVDVFFVISGYLMQALYGHGTAARDFYVRRARRLVPAYFGLLAAALVACAVVTLPGELATTARQALWASVFAANIGYWFDTSYFGGDLFRPLLHLWSLGVEAQFYLFFPLLARFNRRWLSALCLLSFAACLATVTNSPKLPFFMMPFRVWEFGLGMLAARIELRSHPKLGASALAGILLCMLIPADGLAKSMITGHPALPALAITTLTAAVLMFRLPQRVEQSLPGIAAQRVGDASYSLYLAHFPVIALLNYVPFTGTRLGMTPWALPLIALSTLTLYFGLERRGPRLFSLNRSVAALLAVWAMAAVVSQVKLLGYSPRQRLLFAAADDHAPWRCGKLFRAFHPTAKICALSKGVPIMLVGDSHADAIKTSFVSVARKHGWGVYFPIDNDVLLWPPLNANWLRHEADRRHARWVFLHFSALNLTPEILESARRELGGRLVLIEPTPMYSDSVPKRLFYGRPEPVMRVGGAVDQYLRQHPEMPVVRVRALFCDPACRTTDATGRPLYMDADHLTLTGARLLEPTLDAFFTAVVDKRR